MALGERSLAAGRFESMITSAIIPRPLAKLPWRLIFVITGIAMFGRVGLCSGAGGAMQPWASKQGGVFFVFLGIAIAMSWMKESTIKSIAFPLYGVTLVMLMGVEALGFVSKGAQRWLDIGPIKLQPSEFMKPAIVLTLARFYELVPPAEIRKWRAIWPALLLLGVPALLILVQPDLGTCIMVVLCGVTVMFLAGLPWWVFAGPTAAVAVAAPVVFSMMHGDRLSATIFFYVAINLMMVVGLAPVVGVPLPLVSFGGSAVMTVMLCLGLLMALERQQRTVSRIA